MKDLRSAESTFIRESACEQFHSPTNLAAGLSGEVAKIIVQTREMVAGAMDEDHARLLNLLTLVRLTCLAATSANS